MRDFDFGPDRRWPLVGHWRRRPKETVVQDRDGQVTRLDPVAHVEIVRTPVDWQGEGWFA